MNQVARNKRAQTNTSRVAVAAKDATNAGLRYPSRSFRRVQRRARIARRSDRKHTFRKRSPMRHQAVQVRAVESRADRETRSVPSPGETTSKKRLPYRLTLPESLRALVYVNARRRAARPQYRKLTRRLRLHVQDGVVLRERTRGCRW